MASTTAPDATRGVVPGRGDPAQRPDLDRRRVPVRRTLPSGRAVVGALLITMAAVGAFALGRRDDHAALPSYVVVTKAVAPGPVSTRAR